MPRPNAERSLGIVEAGVARYIARERMKREWSYEGLAKRVTDAGCPIQPSAIYKIEKGDPPRRITVAELVAFAHVFGTPTSFLLDQPATPAAELGALWNEYVGVLDWFDQAYTTWQEKEAELNAYVASHPEALEELRCSPQPAERELAGWIQGYLAKRKKGKRANGKRQTKA